MGRQIGVIATTGDIGLLVRASLYPGMKIVDMWGKEYPSAEECLAAGGQRSRCWIAAPESRFPPNPEGLRIINGESIELIPAQLELYSNGLYHLREGRVWVQTSHLADEHGELIGTTPQPTPTVVSWSPTCSQLLRQYERIVRIIRGKLGKRLPGSWAMYALPEAMALIEGCGVHAGVLQDQVDPSDRPQIIADPTVLLRQ